MKADHLKGLVTSETVVLLVGKLGAGCAITGTASLRRASSSQMVCRRLSTSDGPRCQATRSIRGGTGGGHWCGFSDEPNGVNQSASAQERWNVDRSYSTPKPQP